MMRTLLPRIARITRIKAWRVQQSLSLSVPSVLSVVCLLAFSAPRSLAQPKTLPVTQTPYNVQVVLHVAENRFLTPLFQDQLQRDIQGRLQRTLGKLAVVHVTRTHGLLEEIEVEGLGPVLNGYDVVSDVRTCFVLLDYVSGRYRLQMRQHDGLTGLAAARVDQVEVSDREQVAQTIADHIRRDFSLVGTIVSAKGDEVMLAIHGGELTRDLGDWIHPGQAFLPCRVSQEGEGIRSTRLPWTVLEVLPGAIEKGQVQCKLWRAYSGEDLSPGPGKPLHRCLLLPPVKMPLRVRFLDEKTLTPPTSRIVHVRRAGEKEPALQTETNASGLLSRDRPDRDTGFSNFVLLLVSTGGGKALLFPLALMEDKTTVVLLPPSTVGEEGAALDYRVAEWEKRMLGDLRLGNEQLQEINRQILVSFKDALDTARHASKTLTDELEQIDEEHRQIKKSAAKVKPAPNLTRGETMLAELRKRQAEMAERVIRYEETAKEATDLRSLGLKSLLEKAKLHEDLTEFDQAIQSYKTLLKVSPGLDKVRAQLDKLEAAWKIISPEHEKARRFVYETWPRLSVVDLIKHKDEAAAALKTLDVARDRLTPLRFMKANVQHGTIIQKQIAAVETDSSTDAVNKAATAREAARILTPLVDHALAILKGK